MTSGIAFGAARHHDAPGCVSARSGNALRGAAVGISSRKSSYSLFNADLSSFTMGESYDQKDAAGFIKILALPARARVLNTRQKPAVELTK